MDPILGWKDSPSVSDVLALSSFAPGHDQHKTKDQHDEPAKPGGDDNQSCE